MDMYCRHAICLFMGQTGRGLLLALFIALGCGPEVNENPRYGGKVSVGAPGGLAPLNPVITHETISTGTFDLLFERLLQETAQWEIAPDLAASWQASEDYRTWNFQLRKDAKFHDGTPVTAADVVFTFRLIQEYRTDETWGGRPSLKFESIEAPSPYEVRVHFSAPPNPDFLWQMREYILPKHLIEPQLQAGHPLEELPFNRQPIGAGPFRFAGWNGEARITLTAFEEHINGRPYLDTVAVRGDYKDTQQMWAGLMLGELDVVERVAAEDIASVDADPTWEILQNPSIGYFSIELNCRNTSLLQDRRLREALNCAINRRAIMERITGDASVPDSVAFPTGPFLPGSPYSHPAIQVVKRDQKRTAALLDAAGWTDMDGDGFRENEGRSLELLLLGATEIRYFNDVAALLRKDLGEVGIRLHVQMESYGKLNSALIAGDAEFDIIFSRRLSHPIPDLTVSRWHSADANNWSGYANEEVDRLIEQGRSTYDQEQRIEIYRRVHHILAEDLPTLFLCKPLSTYICKKGIKGTDQLFKRGLFRTLPDWYWSPEGGN